MMDVLPSSANGADPGVGPVGATEETEVSETNFLYGTLPRVRLILLSLKLVGHVIFEVDPSVQSLRHVRSAYRGEHGMNGIGDSCHGKSTKHTILQA